jgi:hypothetical protein
MELCEMKLKCSGLQQHGAGIVDCPTKTPPPGNKPAIITFQLSADKKNAVIKNVQSEDKNFLIMLPVGKTVPISGDTITF